MDADAPPPVHPDRVMDGLALNPALPPAMVRRLFAWRRGRGKVAQRTDLTGDLLTEIVATDDHWLLHTLALNERLPDRLRADVVSALAAHRDGAVRAALASRAATSPRDVLERLVDDVEPQVREYLARSPDVPSDLRSRLAADPEPAVRAALARHWTRAPEAVRRVLLTDPEVAVRAAACSTYYATLGPHPVPPADLLPALLADPATRAGAAVHAELDADTLRRLIDDPDGEVRGALAGHPRLPPSARDLLACDPVPSVRVRVFARPDTPERLRAQVHDAVEELARATDAPDLDADAADDDAVLLWYENSAAHTELRTLRLPWVTADPLPHIGSPYVCFRVSAAACKTLPVDAVEQLLDDDEEFVRLTMARTAPHLVDLARAESIERRYRRRDKFTLWWDQAAVLAFPPEVLRRFAGDPEPRLRSFAPRDPDLPPALAEKLAADPDPVVRRAVAPHPRLPLPALLRLLTDPSEHVAEAAGTSPVLPVGQMERLLRRAGL